MNACPVLLTWGQSKGQRSRHGPMYHLTASVLCFNLKHAWETTNSWNIDWFVLFFYWTHGFAQLMQNPSLGQKWPLPCIQIEIKMNLDLTQIVWFILTLGHWLEISTILNGWWASCRASIQFKDETLPVRKQREKGIYGLVTGFTVRRRSFWTSWGWRCYQIACARRKGRRPRSSPTSGQLSWRKS
jgi:hypothetical protein